MNLPLPFVIRTREILGEEFDALDAALQQTPPTSIRLNDKAEYIPSENQVDWCSSGYYLPERPLFTADPLFHAGAYYVQEASSMFLCAIAEQHLTNVEKMLDLCAAPGGKSTLLLQHLSPESLLVSNEIVSSRAHILAENIIKWGNPNVLVTNNEPHDFGRLNGYFDAMLIDAPCSGEGMFRKDPNAIREWSENNVKMCAERQRQILQDVWTALKTDGILIYSTCTFNRLENEENVKWICEELGANLVPVKIDDYQGIVISDAGYRFYPHKIKGEGLFIAVLQKTTEISHFQKIKDDTKNILVSANSDLIHPFRLLKENQGYFINDKNGVSAYDKRFEKDILILQKRLKVVYSGVFCGEIKGKDFVPSPALALSKILNHESCELVEVDYRTAIRFLQNETLNLPEYKRGFLLIMHKKIALGWVKNVGNRSNNLYPKNWKIRMKI